MPKEGHIGMDDLQVKFGYSTAPSSLHFYREDENEFREKIREFAENEIDPVVDEVEREADYSS